MFSFKKNVRIKKIFVGAVGASSAPENNLSSAPSPLVQNSHHHRFQGTLDLSRQ